MKRAWTLLLVVVILALTGCGTQIVDDGSGFLKTSSGEMIAWPSGAEISFESDISVPNELREQLYLGQEELNAQIGRVRVNIEINTSTAPRIKKSKDEIIGDGRNGIYFLPEPWPWTGAKANTDAMTVLVNRGSEIIEADIFYRIETFNARYENAVPPEKTGESSSSVRTNVYAFGTQVNEPKVGADERWAKVAFIHECMHALGFGHRKPEPDSIMYPSLSTSKYRRPFSPNDLLRLQKLY